LPLHRGVRELLRRDNKLPSGGINSGDGDLHGEFQKPYGFERCAYWGPRVLKEQRGQHKDLYI